MPRIVRQKGTTSQPSSTATLKKEDWIDLEPDADQQFIDALGEDKLKELERMTEVVSPRTVLTPFPSEVKPAKINRGVSKPTPRRGVVNVRLEFTDGRPPVYQDVEGTLIGEHLGVVYFQGEWSIWHLQGKRRHANEIKMTTKERAMALAFAICYLPWHLYPADNGGARIRHSATPEQAKLQADYERILNSRKW